MSSDVPAGPEVAPTLQVVASLTLTGTPQSNSSNPSISPASSAMIVIFVSLFILATLVVATCWIRRRRTTSSVYDERPLEKEAVRDVEALAATHPIVPVTPLPGLRWTPQIRSISSPAPDEDWDRKSAAPHTKRARSPSPSNPIKLRNLIPAFYPNSTPARASSSSQNETSYPEKNRKGEQDPPVTPQALAVSGMQTRSLARPGLGFKS